MVYLDDFRMRLLGLVVVLVFFLAACSGTVEAGTAGAAGVAEDPCEEDSFTVSLTVRVDTLVDNINVLGREMHELVPHDGVIFHSEDVIANVGDSVFDVLQREMRSVGIHMSARHTPIVNTAYVEAIGNIFEFDAGPMSGWIYRVNEYFPGFGSSMYMVEPGDVVKWLYSLDLGRDVGKEWD